MHHFIWVIALTGLYFFIILLAVFFSRLKKTRQVLPSLSEFFLADKSLHPLVLVGTYVASLLSTFVVLGLPGLVYAHGIVGVIFLLLSDAAGLMFLFFIGKRLRRYAEGKQLFSPIEIISESYHSKKLGLLIALIFSIFMIPYISLQLVGIGAFIESYTQGQITYAAGVGAMMIIVFLYLLLGGMRAVAYTDLIQLLSMIIGLAIGAAFLLDLSSLSVPELFQNAQDKLPDYFSLEGAQGYYTLTILLSSSLVLVGIFVQPHLLTRTIMAQHDKEINYMVIGTIIGILAVSFFALLYGFYALQIYGDDLAPNLMMGTVFENMAKQGFIGLILSTFMLMGTLGAAMSTADSLLIAISQIWTRDITGPFFSFPHKKEILISKVIMFIVLMGAYMTGLNPPKFMTDLALYSAAGCVILIPTFLCFQWKKRSAQAAWVSIITGLITLFTLIAYKILTGQTILNVDLGFVPMILSFSVYFGLCSFGKQSVEDLTAVEVEMNT